MTKFARMENGHSGGCRFCGYLRDGSHEEIVNSPWLKERDYAAMVSIGALVPGWTLVCPVEHGLNLSTHYSSERFWEVCSQAESVVRSKYGPVRVFEHGARQEESMTGCGTGHAHLHLVPLKFSLAIESMRADSSMAWMTCRVADIALASEGAEYLFVADDYKAGDTTGLLCKLDAPQSQFFRRVIAQRLGMSEFFNYRQYPMLDIARATWNTLSATHRSSLQK